MTWNLKFNTRVCVAHTSRSKNHWQGWLSLLALSLMAILLHVGLLLLLLVCQISKQFQIKKFPSSLLCPQVKMTIEKSILLTHISFETNWRVYKLYKHCPWRPLKKESLICQCQSEVNMTSLLKCSLYSFWKIIDHNTSSVGINKPFLYRDTKDSWHSLTANPQQTHCHIDTKWHNVASRVKFP